LKRAVAVVGVVTLAVGAAAIGAALRPSLPTDGVSAAATPVAPASTATVTRRTMRATEELDGALGYSGEGVIIGGLAGTYTKLPAVGDILALGDEIYEVDGADSSYLLYGDRPAWRPLSRDSSNGADVRQLEESLKAIGVLDEDVEADRHYGANTARAVRSWERRTDQPRDGEIDAGQVTFLPGAVRITDVVPELGAAAQPGSVLARTSGTDLVVTVDLEADRRDILDVGAAVDVELPDGSTSAGTVVDIDSVAQTLEGATEPTVEVTIELAENATAGNLDGAEVTVSVVRQTRPDVLSVPVDALLALREGGYALELVDDGGVSRLVAVEVGLFDDDGVEVRGDIEAGDSVVVPS
jgi:peptidoglycan hydrolase-like protein with peptidoglycan-binding domain